jgi:hypothetical protein
MIERWFGRPRLRGLMISSVGIGFGFCSGWKASRDLTREPRYPAVVSQLLINPGDAPPAVRTKVLDSLRVFQTGYDRRDLNELPDLMKRCFDPDVSVLAMGTNPLEWINGYARVRAFIAHDWTNWGRVHLDLDNAQISTEGPTAWIATLGTVAFHGETRPIRFTAVMTATGDRWVFRQMQYQWAERPIQPLEVLPSAQKRWR